MLDGTKYVWLKREFNLAERQLAKSAELDSSKTDLRTARACQMVEAMRAVYDSPAAPRPHSTGSAPARITIRILLPH